MADCLSFESRVYPPYLPEDRRALAAFLEARGLKWEQDIDFSLALFSGERMVGTGSLAGRILKCLAVDESLQGEGLASSLVSRLEAEAAARGIASPFVFTKPQNEVLFSALGYRRIEEVPGTVVLLEKGDGIHRWTDHLGAFSRPGDPIGALVMNCNPITFGHLHLIRTAAAACAWVFLFVVAEDASAFPAEVRLRLVREETAVIPNLTVIPGSDYLVSRATFPSYFMKDCPWGIEEVHARLDARIFASHIAPALRITRRYLGAEPYCRVTSAYNQALLMELPPKGIEVRVIPRATLGGVAVSASQVRRSIQQGDMEAALRLVPPATAAYLLSDEAVPVIERIVSGSGRH